MARRRRRKNKLTTYNISIEGIPEFSWRIKATNEDEALVKSMENNKESYIVAYQSAAVKNIPGFLPFKVRKI